MAKRLIHMAKRKYKVNRKKVSVTDCAYNSFSSMWSNTFGKESERMSKEEFLMDADMRCVDLTDKEALLRAARQRVASAAHQLTTEQAKNLKRALLYLSDADLEANGFSRQDIKSMTLEAYKFLPTTEGGKGMLSKFYELLKHQGMTVKEAKQWISAEIYGS
jgi:hypothetical protein